MVKEKTVFFIFFTILRTFLKVLLLLFPTLAHAETLRYRYILYKQSRFLSEPALFSSFYICTGLYLHTAVTEPPYRLIQAFSVMLITGRRT